MFEPPLIKTITDEEALSLIVRDGLVGYGVPTTGEICFWTEEQFHAPPGAIRGPWKLCKPALSMSMGWLADGAWLIRTRV
jgi:hypothetical protein